MSNYYKEQKDLKPKYLFVFDIETALDTSFIETLVNKKFNCEEEKIEALQEAVAKKYKFQIVSHVHEIYGYCEECSNSIT